MRRPLIAGNWKMNKLQKDVPGFFTEFLAALGEGSVALGKKADTAFFVPYLNLGACREATCQNEIGVGAQNFHWENSGAFTGETSLPMLSEAGVTLVLLGHSERRQYFGETDETVTKKLANALAAGFTVVACVGELRSERESNATESVVKRQMDAIFAAVPPNGDARQRLIIAYEPVWAIGTGLSATDEQAQEVHRFIRQLIAEDMGDAAAASMRILYGGSASPANIAGLLAQADIDGALVGGASLKPGDFAKMVTTAINRY